MPTLPTSTTRSLAHECHAALRLAADNPLVKAVLTDDTDAGGLLPFLTTRAEPLLAAARARFG